MRSRPRCAKREEEIGLEREFVEVLGCLPDHAVITGFRVTPVVGLVRLGFELVLDPTEVAGHFRGAAQAPARSCDACTRRRRGIAGEEIETFDLPWGSFNIWGATAGMLLTLREVAGRVADPMPIERLLEIMARLRDPERGCPWDLQQDFRSIAPHTIEEAYEVADAIERGDLASLRDELGDLLFQVAFHARLASERGAFAFDDVVDAICDKLTRRHPHVFGDAVVPMPREQTRAWERMKREERAARGEAGALADVPLALARAHPRAQARRPRRRGRLRLARCRRAARQDRRGTGGARRVRDVRRIRGARSGTRRPAVLGGESRAPPRQWIRRRPCAGPTSGSRGAIATSSSNSPASASSRQRISPNCSTASGRPRRPKTPDSGPTGPRWRSGRIHLRRRRLATVPIKEAHHVTLQSGPRGDGRPRPGFGCGGGRPSERGL